jgi:hypothetical protein
MSFLGFVCDALFIVVLMALMVTNQCPTASSRPPGAVLDLAEPRPDGRGPDGALFVHAGAAGLPHKGDHHCDGKLIFSEDPF